MLKKLSSGIFGHFFIRASIIQVCSGILLLAILLPFFNYVTGILAAEEGHTLSNSTLAATNDKLYDQQYSAVIDYCMSIVKDTSSILYMVYSKHDGQELIVRKDSWAMEEKSLPYYKLKFKVDKSTNFGESAYILEEKGHFLDEESSFEYSRPIYIGNKSWGTLTIGFSKQAYVHHIRMFYLTVIAFTLIACLLSLYLFFASSKKIRNQISSFNTSAEKLAAGELSARAPESSIGEIGVLGKAMNSMSTALEEKSARLFQLAQIVEQTNDAFILFDNRLNIIFVNDAITDETGYHSDYFIGMPLLAFADTLNLDSISLLRDVDWITEHHKHTAARDTVILNSQKEPLDVAVRLELIENSEQNNQNFLLVISNISSRKALEKELHQLAYFDKLTDLPNRRMFMDHLAKLIKKSKRNNKSFALFFLDLDNFKYINDTLGHEAGDQFLVKVGNRLKDIFRDEDLVARLGGDEFTILVELNQSDNHVLINIAEKLVNRLAAEPIEVTGRQLNISTSVGIAQFPRDANDRESLFRNADTAMYMAKKNGKNQFSFFSEDMIKLLNQRIELEDAMKKAMLKEGEIYLHYQPIVDLQNNKIVGAEALARWTHPKKGFVSPVEFIEVAEKSNLIIQLSDYLLNIAFAQAATWHKEQLGIYVSVNISVRHFETKAFLSKIKALLDQYVVPPESILLEFTESIMLDSTNETIAKFDELKALGFRIAIDDFGTGYSSLGYIHKLPIDVIKIDRSFVNAMMGNTKSNAIVAAIAKLSGALGIKTIAEGIEDESEAIRLRDMECELGQGYLYSKPISPKLLEEKCTDQKRGEIMRLIAS